MRVFLPLMSIVLSPYFATAEQSELIGQVDSEYLEWKFQRMVDEILPISELVFKDVTDHEINEIFSQENIVKPDEVVVSKPGLIFGAGLDVEGFIWEEDRLRANSGAERQFGRVLLNLKASGVKKITTKSGSTKEVEVTVDIVPKSVVVDTNEVINGNNVNAYWNNNSVLLRPYLLGGISVGYDLDGQWTNRLRVGALKTHGLDNWSFTNHYAWGSRAARSGYNTAVENETKWSEILTLRLGVNNGEWRSGDPDAFRASGDRANSQPAAHFDAHVNLSRFLGRVGPGFVKNFISENTDLFIGATGNYGTSGSLNAATRTGDKEVQHDQVLYAGVWRRSENGRQLKLRIYKAKYERDTGTGCGNNCKPATIEGNGVEFRLDEVVKFGPYSMDFYATKWDLKSDSEVGDPEFFPVSPFKKNLGIAQNADGWAAGLRLNRNELFAVAINAKSTEFDNPLPIINGPGERPGFQDDISYSLTVLTRFE